MDKIFSMRTSTVKGAGNKVLFPATCCVDHQQRHELRYQRLYFIRPLSMASVELQKAQMDVWHDGLCHAIQLIQYQGLVPMYNLVK